MRAVVVLSTALLAVASGLTGCGDEGPDSGDGTSPQVSFDSERVAPHRKDLKDTGSETHPDPANSVVELDLGDLGTGVVWIDQDHIDQIKFQHSDPQDPDAWTSPTLIFEAGDGCLNLHAVAGDEVVAVGAGCYESDAFLQQAPDQAVALVSTDLVDWTSAEVGESIPVPELTEDGVVWTSLVYPGEVDIRWTEDDGFSD